MQLVQEARDEFLAESSPERRPVPLVAASVGPYGAYLADGSEYKGHYGKTREELADFHRERMHILKEAGPDIFACETIPCLVEALAETDVLSEMENAACWISFSCKDGLHTCGDDDIGDCAKALDEIPCVKAIGVNCTAPEYVESSFWKSGNTLINRWWCTPIPESTMTLPIKPGKGLQRITEIM